MSVWQNLVSGLYSMFYSLFALLADVFVQVFVEVFTAIGLAGLVAQASTLYTDFINSSAFAAIASIGYFVPLVPIMGIYTVAFSIVVALRFTKIVLSFVPTL